MSVLTRIWAAYLAVGRAFGAWLSPVVTGLLFATLRLAVAAGMALDPLLFPALRTTRIERPIVIVGNPRSGTTFLQRFLHQHRVGAGLELWRMVYPSLALQKLLRPVLPWLEKVSPARHHSTVAHETSLTSVETDDAGLFLRFFDGFFLYGFVLAWSEREWRERFDPQNRDTSARDSRWLGAMWRRNLVACGHDRVLAKLFSLTAWLPAFLRHYPDARVLYLVRDPLEVIPSGLSLVTGVLDKRMGFWKLPEERRGRFIERLYQAFVMLFERFHRDWTEGRIPRDQVLVVRYSRLMREFDAVMDEILTFTGTAKGDELAQAIAIQAEKQRSYTSRHVYDLASYGLDADRIRRDCAFVYETFGT